MKITPLFALAAAATIGWSIPASAQVIVTPDDTQGWHTGDQKKNGSAAITSEQPRSGSGSLQINTTASVDKAEYTYSTGNTLFGGPKLSELNSLQFDWFRSSASTAAAHFSPSFRIHISNGTYGGTASTLVWEWVYNEPGVAAPTDSWQTVNLLASDELFWRSAGGVTKNSKGAQINWSISDWMASSYFGKNARITGISVGLGTGTDGYFEGYVDNVTFGLKNGTTTTWNFETHAVSAVPEPATVLLLGSGLLALGGVGMVRRRRARG